MMDKNSDYSPNEKEKNKRDAQITNEIKPSIRDSENGELDKYSRQDDGLKWSFYDRFDGTNVGLNKKESPSKTPEIKKNAANKKLHSSDGHEKQGTGGQGKKNIEGKKIYQNLRHQALIDTTDIEVPLSAVDFDRATTKGDKYKMYYGAETNNEYLRAQDKVRKAAPYAAVSPSSKVPLKKVHDKVREIRAPQAGAGVHSKVFMRVMQKKREENRRDKEKHKKANIGSQEEAKSRSKVMEDVVEKLTDEQADIYRLATFIATPGLTLKDSREQVAKLFYVPNNITAKAISLLIMARVMILSGVEQGIIYNLPPIDTAERLCADLGFETIRQMESEMRKGSMIKGMKAYKKITMTDATSHNMDDYLTSIDTKKAKKMRKELLTEYEETLIEFEDVDLDSANESEAEMQKQDFIDVNAVVNATKYKTKVYPFVFGRIYTYKILYYFYLNKYNFVLPFGRTLPDLGWLLAFSYMIDHNNFLGLRVDINNYILKAGGLPLLEKYSFFDETTDNTLRNLFRPLMTESGDFTSLKKTTTAALTKMIKVKASSRKLAEIKDTQEALKSDINDIMAEVNQIAKSGNLESTALFSQRLKTLQSKASISLSKSDKSEELLGLLLNELGIKYNNNRVKLSDYNDVFSYDSFAMAKTMLNYSNQQKDNDASGKRWFLFALIKHYEERADYFSIIYDMIKGEKHGKLLKLLFGSQAALEQVITHIESAEAAIKDEMSIEYHDALVAFRNKTNDFNIEWTKSTIESMIADDPKLAELVEKALKDKVEPEKMNEEMIPNPKKDKFNKIDMDAETQKTIDNMDADTNDDTMSTFKSTHTIKTLKKGKSMNLDEDVRSLVEKAADKKRPEESKNLSKRPPEMRNPISIINPDDASMLVPLDQIDQMTPNGWEQRLKNYSIDQVKQSYRVLLQSLDHNEQYKYLKKLFNTTLSFLGMPGFTKNLTTFDSNLLPDVSKTLLKNATTEYLKNVESNGSPLMIILKKLLSVIIANL